MAGDLQTFSGSEIQKKVDQIVNDHAEEGALIPVLREVQDCIGYLPEFAIQMVAEGLDIPMSRVYGVATFYTLFATEKKGKYVIRLCESAPCYVRGSEDILAVIEEELNIKPGETTEDGFFTLEFTSCLGVCGVAPAVMINDRVHGNLTEEGMREVLEEYKNQS